MKNRTEKGAVFFYGEIYYTFAVGGVLG